MSEVANGERCRVIAGTHAGKSGVVEDRHVSKTGQVTVTVRQDDDVRLKTLARNVAVEPR
jgi:ribosomal protein S4E